MPTERLAPDGVTRTNCTGNTASVQDDPDSPDANWLVATGNTVTTVADCTFPTPTGPPTTGVAEQEIRIRARRFSQTQTGQPSVRIEVYEGATQLANSGDIGIPAGATGLVFSQQWSAAGLVDPTGANVRVVVTGTPSGGSPGARNATDVGAVEWNVTYAVAVDNRNGTFALSGGGAAADSGRKAVSRTVALSGGGALAAGARKAVSRALGALSGGGSLAVVGGPPGVDNRNGSFGLTGGGEALATGRHGRTIALGTIATTGGTPAAAGRKAVQRPAGVISGGGALAVTARHGALRAAALSGGGALAAGARKAVSRVLGLSGGGTPTVSGVAGGGAPKAADGTFALTGGGAAAAAVRKAGRSPALAVTGGGAQVVVVRKGGRTQLVLTGGGAPALSAGSGRISALSALTGGGALVATGASVQPAGPPRGSRGVARTSGYPGPGRTRSDLPGSTLAAVGPGRTRGVHQ